MSLFVYVCGCVSYQMCSFPYVCVCLCLYVCVCVCVCITTGKQGPVDALAANDPKLAEFLALMAPRSRAKLWANDEVNPTQTLDDILVRVIHTHKHMHDELKRTQTLDDIPVRATHTRALARARMPCNPKLCVCVYVCVCVCTQAGGKDPMALTDTHDGASSDDDEYQDLPTTVDGDSKKRLDRYRAVGTGSDGSDSDGQSDGERSEEGHGSEGDEVSFYTHTHTHNGMDRGGQAQVLRVCARARAFIVHSVCPCVSVCECVCVCRTSQRLPLQRTPWSFLKRFLTLTTFAHACASGQTMTHTWMTTHIMTTHTTTRLTTHMTWRMLGKKTARHIRDRIWIWMRVRQRRARAVLR